jgi:hypothetical protein
MWWTTPPSRTSTHRSSEEAHRGIGLRSLEQHDTVCGRRKQLVPLTGGPLDEHMPIQRIHQVTLWVVDERLTSLPSAFSRQLMRGQVPSSAAQLCIRYGRGLVRLSDGLTSSACTMCQAGTKPDNPSSRLDAPPRVYQACQPGFAAAVRSRDKWRCASVSLSVDDATT